MWQNVWSVFVRSDLVHRNKAHLWQFMVSKYLPTWILCDGWSINIVMFVQNTELCILISHGERSHRMWSGRTGKKTGNRWCCYFFYWCNLPCGSRSVIGSASPWLQAGSPLLMEMSIIQVDYIFTVYKVYKALEQICMENNGLYRPTSWHRVSACMCTYKLISCNLKNCCQKTLPHHGFHIIQ